MQLQKTNKEHANKLEALAQILNERSNELETLRKKTNRDVIINNGIHDTLRVIPQSSSSTMHGEPAVREEITGLKYDLLSTMEHLTEIANVRHIVQELQKENLSAAHRITLLESENQLLTSEAHQLRQVNHFSRHPGSYN
jgi:hypothetical protein